jgi:opacity protein-like surface antigen
MKKLLVAAMVLAFMVTALPVMAAETAAPAKEPVAKEKGIEINIGGGHPLYGTHTNDGTTHFDGADSWLFFASIDKETKKYLSFGLMYNYTRIRMGVETEAEVERDDRCWDGDYYYCGESPTTLVTNNFYQPQVETSISTDYYWLNVHVLGPYVKPHFDITKWLEVFGMAGAGAMYVDGKIYGDEMGAAYFMSAGLTVELYKGLGLSGQYLYVDGFTHDVDDINYQAVVGTLMYRF